MKITHNKSDLQFYYRPRDLRTVSSFLSHCKDYGVRVSKDELEYFEKNNLLLPAVWVDRGYGEMRKILIRGEKEWKFVYLDDLDKFDYIDIEPDPYYSSGGFSLGNDHWLKDYQEAGMTLDPVQKEFRAWDTYSKGHYFIKDKQRVKDAYEPFYSVSQLYPLAFLANNMQVSFKYESLFGDDEYIEQKEQLTAELRRHKESLRDTEERAGKWLELTEKTFDFATYAQENFATGDSITRREIFTTLGNSFILKDNKLHIEPCEWFLPIQEQYPELERLFMGVRTNKKATSKEKEMAFADIKSSWLPGPDSNRQPRS